MTAMPDATIQAATALNVDVCVCTFQRMSVVDLLASLGKLELPGLRMRVIVADNDDTPSARERVQQGFVANGLDGVYLHAPARNISVARNACLDAATAPLVAFIDDDEVARPEWLARLAAKLEATRSGVVFGKVIAIYPAEVPSWMPEADMHSTPAPIRNGAISGGYTCNVLMRRDAVGALRFNPAFGRTGGEDTTFFAQLQQGGVAMAYADDAIVEEPVTQGRSSLKWLETRSFRSGQTWGLVELRRGKPKAVLMLMSLAKIAFCLAAAGFTFWSATRWRRAAVRGHLHAGVLAVALGKAPLELYGEARG
jgi:succinoglycan biosynthesis protein ExoM